MSRPFKLKYKKSAFPFKTDKEEVKDDIRYMPGDSDWDSRTPHDLDIIKQHIYNKPRKKKVVRDANRDRSV